MCEKNKDLQKAWKPTIWDYSFNNEIYVISKIHSDGNMKMYRLEDVNNFASLFEMESILKEYFIWLPTQEQLQEILQKGRKWVYYGSYPLTQFCGWIMTSGGPNKFYHHQYKSLFMSINELWLAFIMHELYNKRWTGKEWITIESTDSPNQKE